jgi:3-oxoacyl-[acyl-carrier protein] reductase
MSTQNLTGKNALVCGGSQGIGLAAARRLAERGAAVTILSRTPSPEFPHLAVDLQQIETLIPTLEKQTQPHFQILVNNSGGPAPGPIVTATVEQFLATFRQQVLAAHLLTQWLLPTMTAARYGRIINVISTSVREPIEGLGVSNTIRGAMASWAKTLSREVAPHGVTVNNVLPGATRTGRIAAIIEKKAAATGKSKEDVEATMRAEIPVGRFAEPAELGSLIAFLASPDAAYITGASIPVDGGRMHVI